MNKDILELNNIKKVYTDIAQEYFRNNRFFLYKDDLEYRQKIYNNKIKPNNIREITCKSLCDIIKTKLNCYGYDISIIETPSIVFNHFDIEIKINNNKYLFDPLKDLVFAKYGLNLENFCTQKKLQSLNNYININKYHYLQNNSVDNIIYEKYKNLNNETIFKDLNIQKEDTIPDLLIYLNYIYNDLLERNVKINYYSGKDNVYGLYFFDSNIFNIENGNKKILREKEWKDYSNNINIFKKSDNQYLTNIRENSLSPLVYNNYINKMFNELEIMYQNNALNLYDYTYFGENEIIIKGLCELRINYDNYKIFITKQGKTYELICDFDVYQLKEKKKNEKILIRKH